MTRRIAFVRHGQQDHDLDGEPLTARGQAQARATAAWLVTQSFEGARVLSTKTLRTRETAAFVAAALGTTPSPPLESIPSQAARFAALIERYDDPLIVFVGHHVTQNLIERDFGGARFTLPDVHAAAFVLVHDGATWTCESAFAPDA